MLFVSKHPHSFVLISEHKAMAQLQAGESLLPHYEQVLGQLTAQEVCAVINCKFYPSYVVVFE